MSDLFRILMIGLASIMAIAVTVIAITFLIVPTFKGIGWLFRQVFGFIGGELTDALRSVGTVLMVLILTPLAIGSIIIGRWSATAHYGRAIQNEFKTLSKCLYRIGIGHPARLLCLTPLLDGVERRLPEVVAAAPGRDKPRGKAGQFDGYRIVGSLPVGGSGSKLYIAEPDEVKAATFERAGQRQVDKVVIKSFSIHDGSSLPQIVRESRSLDAAKKLGLVLDHELTPDRFYYVMRYVPGESLTTVTQQLHAESGASGLDDRRLKQSLAFVADLVRTLDGYHRGGLWHKDVKPDNIIVDGQQAHLVDFGLLSSLRSAMTLTTHGTEYFRDPEMVRMALKGVKVHEVDGAKFDLFAAGAVIYSVVENSFPAHGALSQISKRCPDALRWIVRRAMTDYDKRYASASEMLADLEFVRAAVDPFALRPAELPSMRGGGAVPTFDQGVPPIPQRQPAGAPGFAPQAIPVGAPLMADPALRKRPKIRVTDWWTGKYAVDPEAAPIAQARAGSPMPGQPFAINPNMTPGVNPSINPGVGPGQAYAGAVPIGGIGQVDASTFVASPQRPHMGPRARSPLPPRVVPTPGDRRPAKEQIARAKARVKAAQDRAHARMSGRLSARRVGGGSGNPTGMNPGVAFAAGIAVLVGVGSIVAASRAGRSTSASVDSAFGENHPSLRQAHNAVNEITGDVADGLRDGAEGMSDALRDGVNQFMKTLRPSNGAQASEAGAPDAPARLLASVGAAPDSHTGNILFVSDVVVIGSQPYVRRYINQMEDSSEALRRMGFTVIGDAAHSGALGSDEFNRQVELISQARRAVGTTPKGTDRMVDAVLGFTEANPDVAGVVWIWPDSPNNPTQFHVVVVGPDGAELHDTDAEHFDQALVTGVHAAFAPRE